MTELFGQQWVKSYGESDGSTRPAWQGALGEFSANEVAAALKSCEDWESKFPPTFPEFKALCTSARAKARPNWTEQRISSGRPLMTVLREKATTPIAKEELAKMDRIMAGEGPETREESYRKLRLARRWGALVLAIVLSGCACQPKDLAWTAGHALMGNPEYMLIDMALEESRCRR